MFDKFYIIFLWNWKFVINLIWFKDTKNCLFQFFYLCNGFTQNSYNNENINKILVFITHKNTTLIVNFFLELSNLKEIFLIPADYISLHTLFADWWPSPMLSTHKKLILAVLSYDISFMNSIRVANQTNKTDRFQVSFKGLYLLNMYIIILTGSYGKILPLD